MFYKNCPDLKTFYNRIFCGNFEVELFSKEKWAALLADFKKDRDSDDLVCKVVTSALLDAGFSVSKPTIPSCQVILICDSNMNSKELNFVLPEWRLSVTHRILHTNKNTIFEALNMAQSIFRNKESDMVLIVGLDSLFGAGAIVIQEYNSAIDIQNIYGELNFVDDVEAEMFSGKVGYMEISDNSNLQKILDYIKQGKSINGERTCALGAMIPGPDSSIGMLSLIKAILCVYHRFLPSFSGNHPLNGRAINSPFYLVPKSRTWFVNGNGSGRKALLIDDVADKRSRLLISEVLHQTKRTTDYINLQSLKLFLITGENYDELIAKLIVLKDRVIQNHSLTGLSQKYMIEFQNQRKQNFILSLIGGDHKKLCREIDFAVKGIPKAVKEKKEWKTPSGSYFTPSPLGINGKIAFVYSGIHNSYTGLGRELFHIFPSLYDDCLKEFPDLSFILREKVVYPRTGFLPSKSDTDKLDSEFSKNIREMFSTSLSFSALYTAIFQNYFGIKPQCALGYSLGEITMFVALNVWKKSGIEKFYKAPPFIDRLHGPKSILNDNWGLPSSEKNSSGMWGAYILKVPPESVRNVLRNKDRVYLTLINTPKEVMISGDPVQCNEVVSELDCQYIPIENYDLVIHCKLLASEYSKLFSYFNIETDINKKIDIDFYSSTICDKIELDRDSIANEIAQSYCQPVDFPRLINSCYDEGARIFIEIGPKNLCCNWIGEILKGKPHLVVPSNVKGVEDYATLIKTASKLACHKVDIDLVSLMPLAF